MASVTVKELMDAGVHYGHQTSRWNPKMKPYVFGEKNGIYIINLNKTAALANKTFQYVRDIVARGGQVLFVGTKRQAQDTIRDEAKRCDMHYVNTRWLGGTLTNFKTIKSSIDRLKKLEKLEEDVEATSRLPKKEVLALMKEKAKLDKNLSGLKNLKDHPDLIFVIDPEKEKIAVDEGRKLNIPVVGIIDTNGDPDGLSYIIPGNDDAIKSISLLTGRIADACVEGKEIHEKNRPMEDQMLAEAAAAKEQADAANQENSDRVVIKKRERN